LDRVTGSDHYDRDTNTEQKRTETGPGMRFTGAAANYIDERTSASVAVKTLGRKIFPDHWSFMLGEVALYSFVVILITGTFLTFFYDPSMTEGGVRRLLPPP
jgi:ubiquinol-cytochrome c reductase cytochrome b subunit